MVSVTQTNRVSSRPVLIVEKKDTVSDLAKKLAKTLENAQAANPSMFRTHSDPVRLAEDIDGKLFLQILTKDRMVAEARRRIDWRKRLDKDGGGPVFVIANAQGDRRLQSEVVNHYLAIETPGLPPLRRLSPVPLFDSAGKLIVERGYYEESGIYYEPDVGLNAPPINASPEEWEIAICRDILMEPLWDFPFSGPNEGQCERANAAALTILPFVREMIDGPTPMHLIRKPPADKGGSRTGGSLLAKVALLPYLGREPAMMTDPRWGAEWSRKLFSHLLGNPMATVLDNVNELADESLLSALTSKDYADRVMGSPQTREVRVRCVWVATGNAPELAEEMIGRTVRIQLVPGLPHPKDKRLADFKHPDLADYVLKNRNIILYAILTVVQAWIAAGRPKGTKVLAGYKAWSEIMGGILQVAGIPGFLENREEFERQCRSGKGDLDQQLAEFLGRCFQERGEEAFKVADALDLARESGLVPYDAKDRAAQTRLGSLLASKTGNGSNQRMVGGLILERAGRKDNSLTYRVRKPAVQ